MEDLDAPFVMVPNVADMSDEILIKHMEMRHDEDIKAPFRNEPDRVKKGLPPRLRDTGPEWRTYHDYMHRLYDGRENGPYNHEHKEATNG